MKRCIPCLLSQHGPKDFDAEDILEDENALLCEDPQHDNPQSVKQFANEPTKFVSLQLSGEGS